MVIVVIIFFRNPRNFVINFLVMINRGVAGRRRMRGTKIEIAVKIRKERTSS